MASENAHITLDVKQLTIGYFQKKRPLAVAEKINFSVAEGELVGLVGSNGIGKSTLLRTISGMQPKLKGEILVKNKALEAYTNQQLADQLGVVLTEAPASKNLTVLELVSLGRSPYTNWSGRLSETDKKAIQSAIDNTEIGDLATRKCFELSDGQLQRVYIARALAQDTPLIVLDEPTTHLDLYHRAYVLKLLKKLAHEFRKTILFSTHEIDLAIQLSDKMIVMTSEATFFDAPSKLIEAGRFDVLFPKDSIHFDSETGSFTIKN